MSCSGSCKLSKCDDQEAHPAQSLKGKSHCDEMSFEITINRLAGARSSLPVERKAGSASSSTGPSAEPGKSRRAASRSRR